MKCPKCQGKLKQVHTDPDYWMCYKCIKGYNNEELKNPCPFTKEDFEDIEILLKYI